MNYIQVRRGFKVLALTAVLGYAVVGLSQCQMVEDNVTGIKLNSPEGVNGRSECVKDCNEKYKDASRAEYTRLKEANRACGKDKKCLKDEKATHKANKKAIKDAKDECKRGCYNEGGGDGGR